MESITINLSVLVKGVWMKVWILIFYFTYGNGPGYSVLKDKETCLNMVEKMEKRGGDYAGNGYCFEATGTERVEGK